MRREDARPRRTPAHARAPNGERDRRRRQRRHLRPAATLGIRKRPGAGFTEVATCLRDARPYLEGRACAEKVVFGVVEAKGCFTAEGDALVARSPVKLNGVSFVPVGGASVVLYPQLHRIASSRAEVSLGSIRVRGAEPVNLPLSPVASPRPARTDARQAALSASRALHLRGRDAAPTARRLPPCR